MKKLVIILPMLIPLFGLSQDSYKRQYRIPKGVSQTRLLIERIVPFDSLTIEEQCDYMSEFSLGNIISYWEETTVNGKTVEMLKMDTIDASFFSSQKVTKTQSIKRDKHFRGYVKFEENRLYINPFLKKDVPSNEVYYIELENREPILIPFWEFSASSITIPLKYRGANDQLGIKEEFTSSFNLNFIIGRAYGRTKYFHRKKVGNLTRTWKITGGLVLGASTLKLNSENTSTATEPIKAGDNIEQGMVSLGYGLTYSYENINFGLFSGWDYSIGNAATKWNYNGRPWFGFGVGYSLFKL